MEKCMSFNENFILELQHEERLFLTKTLMCNEISIKPTEIEPYYYKKGVFEDESVHQNELQTNKHKNHFYIHRWGTKQSDSYKGGNRAALDFVVSDDADTYYSFLIRSAIINGESPVIGPNKVLRKIKEVCHLDNEGLENLSVKIVSNNNNCDVLFSNRINITKGFIDCKLRAVLCDENFKNNKYLMKEKMVIDFIMQNNMSQNRAMEFAKDKLGYIPSLIK